MNRFERPLNPLSPRLSNNRASTADPSALELACKRQAVKVLIVNADPGNHNLTAEILIQRGCQLLEVNGSEGALRIAHQEKPDIAIVDMLTPKLDRGDFLRQLRRDPAIARMPVIFYMDGYLEIASRLARDVENLLTPMLLCQEAIGLKVNDERNGSVLSSNKEKEDAQSESKNIQDLFTFVCESGGGHFPIGPADLIGEVVDDARATFPASIEITSDYSEDLWMIEGDRRQLHRVLSNLFLNARAAMPQGGSLLVWARNFNIDQRYASMTLKAKPGRYVMLRVSDTGSGTARPVIDNIFSPFLDGPRTGAGTSLALIKSHGGFMSVYSNMDKGTTFQIFLPAKVNEDRKPGLPEQSSEAKRQLPFIFPMKESLTQADKL